MGFENQLLLRQAFFDVSMSLRAMESRNLTLHSSEGQCIVRLKQT